MPKLIIDDREIEVAPGTKVIEAAARLGIMIPRLCYHPGLGSVGACRLCGVKFVDGPIKGIQMSCMIDAQEGMVISTLDEEAVDFRRQIIEWLMLNHPHDCPVCDEGGHCLLQDMTVSGGHGIRRYRGAKRTYPDQYLGPLLQHEMNRCIHCYRCIRFYQEFAGYRDMGVLGSGNRTYFGRFEDGCLDSPFSGNLGDICPTGVFTDKPSRFFGRRWDYQRTPSICINCCLGCHTVANVRYREVKRQEARFSEAVNGHFICDRGRYGFFYAGHESRPRRAKLPGKEVSLQRALQAAREQLAKIGENFGAPAIAAAGSARSSLETQVMLQHLCRSKGWRKPAFFTDSALASKVKTAVSRLEPELALSLREVEMADFILALGVDAVNEAPMLAMAMRQAQRRQARIIVLDPRPLSLPFDFLHLAVLPDDLTLYLGSLLKKAVDPQAAKLLGRQAAVFYDALAEQDLIAREHEALMHEIVRDLKRSRRPVVICGTDIVPPAVPGLAADAALLLQAAAKPAGLFYLLPGANAFGAGLFGQVDQSLVQVIEGIEKGAIKSLILTECDPYRCFGDRKRLERALNKLDLLMVIDYLNSESVQNAHIFLPAATLYEAGGVFINQEGRMQAVQPAYAGGMPIAQISGGGHPPRQYGTGIPGAQHTAAWMILAQLAGENTVAAERQLPDIRTWLADAGFDYLPAFEDIPEEGLRLTPAVNTALRFVAEQAATPQKTARRNDRLQLMAVDLTFGTEELSACSVCLQERDNDPCLLMHTMDAESLGVHDGDRIAIRTERGSLEAQVRVAENMAAGVLVVPRHQKLGWQIMDTGQTWIGKQQIHKVTAT